MSGGISPAVTFGLNQLGPALFSLGPVGIYFGTVVAIFSSLFGGLGEKEKPISYIVTHDNGRTFVDEEGQAVNTGSYGALSAWVESLAGSYVKLMNFFSNSEPDFSGLDIKIESVVWSTGFRSLDFSFGAFTEPLHYDDYQTFYTGEKFNSTDVFYKVLRLALLNSNSPIDARIKTILHGIGTDKKLLEDATAERKIDIATAKKNMADLQVEISRLASEHGKLNSLQDDDLRQQLAEFLNAQAAAASDQFDILANIVAQSDSAAPKTASPAVPLMLIASLIYG